MSRSIIKTLAICTFFSVVIFSFEDVSARIPGARGRGSSERIRGGYRDNLNRGRPYDSSYNRQRYDGYRDGWQNRNDRRGGYYYGRPGYSYGYDYPAYNAYYGQPAYSGYDYVYPPYSQQMEGDGSSQQMPRGGNANQPANPADFNEGLMNANGTTDILSNPSSPSELE